MPTNRASPPHRPYTRQTRLSREHAGALGCTRRGFGYCGNDFAATRDLGKDVVDAIEHAVVRIGEWLRTGGYLGAFGVDFLVKDGVPLFTEVNPRFQGSTHLSCQISVDLDESCLLTEHLAAFLGLGAPQRRPLWDLAMAAPPVAHLVIHSTASAPGTIDPADLVEDVQRTGAMSRVDVLTSPALLTEPGGTVARMTFRGRLTVTGFEIADPLRTIVTHWSDAIRGRSGRPAPNVESRPLP